jgi:ribosomal protein S12 methylthiotransferase
VIRSTFIVGFPGETDADFDELLDFLEVAQLDRVGCFTYSAVDGATANALSDHVPEAIKQERYHRFMLKQQAISTAKLQQRIGQQVTVLVETRSEQGYLGRCYADAPEIDGLVHIATDAELTLGEFCEVQISDADEYDLYATPSR